MIGRIKNNPVTRSVQRFLGWFHGWLVPALLRRRTFRAAFFASLLAVLYWGVVASDRYVSEAHVVIQHTDLSSGRTLDFGALLSGNLGGGRPDQMLLRDYLLSVDMLQKLDAQLNLRAHYSDPNRDLLSRMWGADRELELFYQHYLSRVSIEYDEQAGVLVIKAQAYDPRTAHAITAALVREGERYMNELAHRLAQDQVGFLESQVTQRAEEAGKARQAMLAFQNERGLVSPQGTVESLASVVNKLEAQLIDLNARRGALLGYLSPTASSVVEIDLQVEAIEKQIAKEQARLASPKGKTLNRAVEEYQRLQMTADFAQDVYKTALTALETGRVEAIRTLKKVSIIQAPTMPQYPLQPRRIYNIVVFVLATLLAAGVIHLMAAIIRDHKD